MSKRKTHEQFVKEVFDLVGNSYSVFGEYKGAETKIFMRHNCENCNNYEWEVRPSDFLQGSRCPKCAGHVKMTTDEFKQQIYELVGDSYSVLEEYKGTDTKILMRHNVCNHEWSVAPNNFIVHNSRCPKCSGKMKKTTESFKQEVQALYGDEYTVLGTYKRNDAKILMRHNCNKCNNYEWSVSPVSFSTGKAHCPVCSGKMKTTESFKNEVFDLVGDEYSVLGTYIKSSEKILMKHNTCNHEWEVETNSFLQGTRCPYCTIYKGPEKIKNYLKDNNINFEIEYKIADCKAKLPLPFDVAVLNDKKELVFLIEYQGQQHYGYVEHFHKTDDKFVERIIYDSIKRAYCEYNNIPLLEIRYDEFDNIEEILERELKDLLEENNKKGT